jgi:hypothetical protein
MMTTTIYRNLPAKHMTFFSIFVSFLDFVSSLDLVLEASWRQRTTLEVGKISDHFAGNPMVFDTSNSVLVLYFVPLIA